MILNSESLNVSTEGTPWESELKASLHADCEDGKSWMKMSGMQLYKMQHGEKNSTKHCAHWHWGKLVMDVDNFLPGKYNSCSFSKVPSSV